MWAGVRVFSLKWSSAGIRGTRTTYSYFSKEVGG